MTPLKYYNRRVEDAGRSFDSQGERDCFHYLTLLERAGEIADLQTQVTVEIVPNIRYRADFRFTDVKRAQTIWADFKGFENEVWLLKKKLWRLFGPGPLQVIKGKGTRMFVHEEIIPSLPVEWVMNQLQSSGR